MSTSKVIRQIQWINPGCNLMVKQKAWNKIKWYTRNSNMGRGRRQRISSRCISRWTTILGSTGLILCSMAPLMNNWFWGHIILCWQGMVIPWFHKSFKGWIYAINKRINFIQWAEMPLFFKLTKSVMVETSNTKEDITPKAFYALIVSWWSIDACCFTMHISTFSPPRLVRIMFW